MKPVDYYGFNGKEEEDYLTGHSDFGNRVYDSRLARWHAVDSRAEEAPNWSPYRAFFDSPIRFIDCEGDFEIDPSLVQNYPHAAIFISNLSLNYEQKSDKFRSIANSYSEVSDKTLMQWMTNDHGPRITAQKMESTWGYVFAATPFSKLKNPDGSNRININGQRLISHKNVIEINESLLDRYEKITSDPNSSRVDRKAVELVLEATLYHELMHFGDMQDNLLDEDRQGFNDKTISVYDELGLQFEKSAYGEVIDFNTAVEYVKRNYPDLAEEDRKDQESKFMELMHKSLNEAIQDSNKSFVPISTDTSNN